MASQITHIPYGNKVKEKFLSHLQINERDFYIGNVFPDIRYLGYVDRDKTHFHNPTVEGLLNLKSDFQRGMYAHALIDLERERVITDLGLYNLIPKDKYVIYALKFLEDEYTYTLINNWEIYKNYLQDIIPEELDFVPKDTALKWHHLLIQYFQKPTWENTIKFAKDFQGITPELLDQIKIEIEKLRQDQQVIEIIQNTYNKLFL